MHSAGIHHRFCFRFFASLITMANTPKTSTRLLARLVMLTAVLAACSAAFLYWRYLDHNLLSEDAVLQADVVHISTPVPGRLIELSVKEGDRVSQGQVLFRIDPQTYQLREQQAQAELAVAKAALNAQERRVRAETANASIADQQIERARTNLTLAEKTYARLEPLAKKGYVTKQDLDAAYTAMRDAQVSLGQAQAQSVAARELISELEAAKASVNVGESAVSLAQKALSDTVVRAPHDGLIVGLKVATGEYLGPDQALFTLIDSRQWFATALYRETELGAITAGMCAQAYVLADPSRVVQGRVASIGWGVASSDFIPLPRSLPYVQKSLNWVRVAQRFPVRIELIDPPADLMRIGASASVVVRTDEPCTN